MYRDVAKWLNSNPDLVLQFSVKNVHDSRLVAGKPISSITCEGERIKLIK